MVQTHTIKQATVHTRRLNLLNELLELLLFVCGIEVDHGRRNPKLIEGKKIFSDAID